MSKGKIDGILIEVRFNEHRIITAKFGGKHSRAVNASAGLDLDPELVKKIIANRVAPKKAKVK